MVDPDDTLPPELAAPSTIPSPPPSFEPLPDARRLFGSMRPLEQLGAAELDEE